VPGHFLDPNIYGWVLKGETVKLWTLLVVALFATMSFAADHKADEQALLDLHSKAREAHLKGDANLLADGLPEQFMDVGRGKFSWVKREEFRDRFTKVFATRKYSRWDHVVPPIVHISPDGKTGWMAVQLHAELTDHQDGKAPEKINFDMAWMANYEKQNGKWKMVAISYSVPPGK
jgi:hypothetical protein